MRLDITGCSLYGDWCHEEEPWHEVEIQYGKNEWNIEDIRDNIGWECIVYEKGWEVKDCVQYV